MSQTIASGHVEQTIADFTPFFLSEVEISCPVEDIPPNSDVHGNMYQRAMILVRIKGEPLGYIEVPMSNDGISANTILEEAWRVYGTTIVARLEASQYDEHDAKPEVQLPFVSVVIATHNSPQRIVPCLNTLLEMEYPSFELIVVDNAPRNDETKQIIARLFGDNDKVRYCQEPRSGLSWARNCGLAIAKSELVAFTDDDVIADRYWLRSLVETLISYPQAMCVTGMIIPSELETLPQLWLEQFGGFSKGFHQSIYTRDSHGGNPLYPYTAGTFGSGANMCFRASFLRMIGGFDTALGTGTSALGGEDLAVFFEVIVRGGMIIYEPNAIVHHPHHRDYHKLRRQIYGYGAGLSAFLTACIVRHPSHLFQVPLKMIAGVKYLFSDRSPKNRRKGTTYPAELTRLELLGILSGPFRYIMSLVYQRLAYRTRTTS